MKITKFINMRVLINLFFKSIIESLFIISFYAAFIAFYFIIVMDDSYRGYSYYSFYSMIYTIPCFILISIIIKTIKKI